MAPRGKSATLNIVIAGDAKGAQKAFGQTEAGAKGLTRSFGGMATAVGGFLAGGAIVRWGKEAIDTYRSVGGELMALKRLTGGSDEFIPGLFVAAQQSGVAIDKMTASLGVFQSKVANGAIDKLGIDTKNAAGETRAFEEILGDLSDTYAELAAEDRAGFARNVFGRGGGDMMKILGKSREEMAGFIEEAKELGITLNSADLQQAIQNQRDFQLALMAAKVTMGKELLPVVTQFTTVLADNMPAIAGMVGSVASAFNALPGPLQATVGLAIALGPALRLAGVMFGPIVTGLKAIATSRALDSFRLGLMGVTDAGAGAANAVGGLIRTATSSPAIMGAAAVGVGLLVAAFLEAQAASAAAKRNIDSLVSSAEAAGESIEQVFRDKLATTLAGAEGGFADSYGKELAQALDILGVSADEFFGILRAGGPELQALIGDISKLSASDGLRADEAVQAAKGVGALSKAWEGAAEQQAQLDRYQRDLGASTDDLSDSTTDATTTTDGYTAAVNRAASADRSAAEAIDRRRQRLDARRNAEEAAASAEEARVDAATAVREAEESAAEANADALERETQAREDAQDAAESYVEAVATVAERQADLNQALADAAERYQDLQLEAREAADAQKQAALDVEKARIERDRVLGNSGSTRVEREQAQLNYEQALTAQAQATEAAQDATQAAQQSINEDEGVVSAKEAVADAVRAVEEANLRVVDANARVKEAERDTTKTAQEGAATVADAKKAVEDATKAVIEAELELAAAGKDGADALRAQQRALRDMAMDYAPGSPYREYIDQMLRDLTALQSGALYGIGPGGQYGSPDAADRATPPAGIPQDESRDPVRPRARGVYAPTINVYGSSLEERRLLEQHQDRQARKFARDMTGG